jgi:hypothetical protein
MPWKEGAQPLLTPQDNFEDAFKRVITARRRAGVPILAPELFLTWLEKHKKRYEQIRYSQPGPSQRAAITSALNDYLKELKDTPVKPALPVHAEPFEDWCERKLGE